MIYGKDQAGVWHIAIRTFADSMHTKCGLEHAEAFEFQAPSVAEDRPTYCIRCVPPLPKVCYDDPQTGQVYSCNSFQCPVHGKRNLELANYKTWKG